VFQRPIGRRIPPPSPQIGQKGGDGFIILHMVGAKIQPCAFLGAAGDGLEKLRLQHAVLVMTLFGPRIREEHPDLLESDAGREGV
jgi:hypothetical protein